MHKFTKRYRRLQKFRNWLYEFTDLKLVLAITGFMISLMLVFEKWIR